jgi:Uma2 family endonuclease
MDLLEAVGEGAIRLTYDCGFLEIEVPSRQHEQLKSFVRQLVEMMLFQAGIDFEPAGSTTWQREDLQRGLEADECYHIQHIAQVKGKIELDLAVDPAPDLAIEIDVTSRSLDKVAIYQSLGVPEIWRVREDGLVEMSLRGNDGQYRSIVASESIPKLSAEIVSRYLRLRAELGHTAALRRFQTEVLGQ